MLRADSFVVKNSTLKKSWLAWPPCLQRYCITEGRNIADYQDGFGFRLALQSITDRLLVDGKHALEFFFVLLELNISWAEPQHPVDALAIARHANSGRLRVKRKGRGEWHCYQDCYFPPLKRFVPTPFTFRVSNGNKKAGGGRWREKQTRTRETFSLIAVVALPTASQPYIAETT